MIDPVPYRAPLRLVLNGEALVANWRWLAGQGGGAACGAAVKANGYGLGAGGVVERLSRAGCRDFFVATWAEAARLADHTGDGVTLAVLHGVRDEDMEIAASLRGVARPVLNTAQQARRWRDAGAGAASWPCDVMIDTGMNRLGLSAADVADGAIAGLAIDTLMSHLASADEDTGQDAVQLAAFGKIAGVVPARRRSLANSAGVCLGSDYAFDLTRPGIALYGGIPRGEAAGHIRSVVRPQAQVIQLRNVRAGETVGYNATWHAPADTRVAIINLGYADGYLRAFSGRGGAIADGEQLPVIGRISMDLTALSVPNDCALDEGDWVEIDYDLREMERVSSLSQYELLTGLGARYDRVWE
jgi:alanine racemase